MLFRSSLGLIEPIILYTKEKKLKKLTTESKNNSALIEIPNGLKITISGLKQDLEPVITVLNKEEINVHNNYKGYTRANAKVFSDEMKAKLKTNVYGDPDYVAHVLRYYHIGNNNIVEVAKSQVGTTSGSKYWTWYGFNKKVNWCAIFVSWCANESGMLDDNSVPKFSLCTDGENWYKKNNRWKDKTYVPMTGNIIFFDWQQDGHTDHVGIVEKVENGKVFTIEGNSKDEVRKRFH